MAKFTRGGSDMYEGDVKLSQTYRYSGTQQEPCKEKNKNKVAINEVIGVAEKETETERHQVDTHVPAGRTFEGQLTELRPRPSV